MIRYAKKSLSDLIYYIMVHKIYGMRFYSVTGIGASELSEVYPGSSYQDINIYLNNGYIEISKEEFEANMEI